ncbi:hypothetical protein Zmor_005220 [Zophobas morio]|uniref:Uncharacterized protein n=1 Tax=Zophobas morio TaxID=2755281 RepID=A0AA38MLR6_9CUCU|nr:hypothetical protein Zmor_005220 [Zophobas morio]
MSNFMMSNQGYDSPLQHKAVNGYHTSDDPKTKEIISKFPFLKAEDIADSVLYVLATPPHVQVHELMIKPVGEPV